MADTNNETSASSTIHDQARKAANLVPVNMTPEDTARIADAVSSVWEAENEALRARVIYLEWSMETAVDNIERGREFDALHGLRAPLKNGREVQS